VRKWTDGELLCGRMAEQRTTLPWPGAMGPDALWDAIADRPHETKFQTARLRIAMPGRYWIDHLAGDWKVRVSACDGERQWTVYPNRVVTYPPSPLTEDWARLADPAWLLAPGWLLSAGGPEDVGGRRCWRIWADARPQGDTAAKARHDPREITDVGLFDRAVATVDAELGILLRLAYLVDGRSAVCFELRGLTVPATDDPADFRVRVPPGTRLVEGSSPLAVLDVPAPVHAAWTVGKAGLTGASAVAGWLRKQAGRHEEGDPRGS
jgi:hypothetical protein